jgi:hypothetical protein
MSLKSDLIVFAVKTAIGKCVYNENEGLLDNSRGKRSPDWITRTWDWFTNQVKRGFDYVMSNFSSIFMGGLQTIYQFDWARTDKMIWEDIDATNKSFAQQLGRMGASSLFRSTALGMSRKAKMKWPTIDPVVLATMDEENAEEMKATINGAMTAIKSGLLRNAMNITYMSGRALLGLSPKEYTEPWSFAAALDNAAEWAEKNIPVIGGFLKGFYEQAEDDFFEIGFLITSGVQSQYAMSKAAIKDSKGKERIIKYYPDSTDKTNFTFISGSQEEIKSTISTEMAVASSLANKDMGMVIAMSPDKAMKASMGLRMVTCRYYASDSGGSTLPSGKRAPSREMEIRNIKPTVDYEKLKTFLTPIDGGYIKVVAHLSDGHQLSGFFSTEPEGKSYFRSLIDNICVGDLVRFQHFPADEDIKKRPHLGRFKISSVTVQIRKKTTDVTKKKFIDSNGDMYQVAIKNFSLKPDKPKPDWIDAWMLNPFIQTVS